MHNNKKTLFSKKIGFLKTIPGKYKAAAILSALYLSIAILLTFARHYYSWPAIVIVWILITVSLFFLYAKPFFSNKTVKAADVRVSRLFLCFLLCFGILLAGQCIYWFAWYPGGFNLDALGQWEQVHGAPLNNWHPVAVTLLYKFITHFHDSLAACILVQLTVFCFAVSLLLTQLYRRRISLPTALITATLITFNPAIGLTNVCLYKDIPFSICVVLLYSMLFEIYDSNGSCLRQLSADIPFALLILAITLTRHNGIFLIFGVFLGLMIWFRKYFKQVFFVFLSAGIAFLVIEGPVYSSLHVIPHPNPVGEAAGIPMAIMTNAFLNDSEHCPLEVQTFLEEIEPDRRVWEANYVVGWWDSCKWTIGNGEDGMLLQGDNLSHILRLTIKTIPACPDASYQAFREATRCVWQVIGNCNWYPYVYIEDNFLGIYPEYNPVCQKIANALFDFSSESFLRIYLYNINLGFCIWLLYFLHACRNGEGRKCIVILPAFFYNIGTALFLCSPNVRYFYFNEILFLPVIFFLYYLDKRKTAPLPSANDKSIS